ncbi:hypothetical protein HUG10_19170 (plasmid) [Halorarum halophilum]|uniref:Uncharacterized protein n=1 Tax=Halorarum halophilum TaxID=2743090 RepID=A0A7D5GH81_9EURY|nr:hypothetical protein [Halobaculum halophilum]QLG29728.1 hypothetical protein HUG10_19170 [Halobaculum halophilum]
MNVAGISLCLVGLAGVLWPEPTLRFWFLGMLEEGSLSDNGRAFFRGLGVLCVLVGLLVATST